MFPIRVIPAAIAVATLLVTVVSAPAQTETPAERGPAPRLAPPIGANPADLATLFHLALEARRRGDPEAAADWLELVVRADPGAVVPRLERAGALLEAGRPEAVEAALGELPRGLAEGDSATAAEVHRLRAAAALRLGRPEAALAGYEAAAALAPGDLGLRAQLIGLYRAAGREDAAVEHLRVAADLRPQSADLRLQLGQALLGLDRWTEAELAFRVALALAGDTEDAWDGLGLALAGQSRFAAAAEAFRAGLAATPSSSLLYEHLGDALLDDGQVEDALTAYRRAATLGPGREGLADKIQRAEAAGSR